MSTGPSEESVEHTKRQIRQLVNEISEMSKTDMAASEYYPGVLQRVVQALAAAGGAIWLVDGEGVLKPSYQIQMSPELMDAENEDASRHGKLLARIASRGQPELVPPMSIFGDDQSIANPTRNLLVVCPVVAGKALQGIFEVFQRADAPPDTQRGYLRFLEHIAKLIGDWLKGQSLQQVTDRQQLWQQSDHFARLVHDNLDLRDTAFTIANEGRRLIECDRVSVATLTGNRVKVIAISGQDTIESRSNIVTSLNELATRVVRSGEPLWYDGTTEDLPPQIEEAIEEYVDLSHGRTIAVLPIRQPERTVEGDVLAKQTQTNETSKNRAIIGALIVEQIETQLSRTELEGRVDLVYEHACRALANTLTFNNLFLMPVWRFLGRSSWLFRGNALPKTTTVLAITAAVLLGMFLIPIDFDLEGNGKLQPLEQRQVFALTDGEVQSVLVKHGDKVQKGQPVVGLVNRDLEVQIAGMRGKYEAARSQFEIADWTLSKGKLSPSDTIQLQSQRAEAELQMQNFATELSILENKRENLSVVSPLSGIVVTWDVEKTLRARPVAAGQVLMTVAATEVNEEGKEADWVVEVLMPEKRMKFLDEAMSKSQDGILDVEFIQVPDPSKRLRGKLSRADIAQRSEVDADEGAAVKLRVRPNPDDIDELSRIPGIKVIADVKCGKKNAAFVWFHEVVEWVRANVLF
jgi:multidrug efflux pump subunit AcrA (membrane-fusion protein)